MSVYLSTPNQTASIEVRNLGARNKLLFCDFDALAQERFFSELERRYDIRQFSRSPMHNRPAASCIRIRLKADQTADFIDEVDSLLQELYEY